MNEKKYKVELYLDLDIYYNLRDILGMLTPSLPFEQWFIALETDDELEAKEYNNSFVKLNTRREFSNKKGGIRTRFHVDGKQVRQNCCY
jgi:hypothetical protein